MLTQRNFRAIAFDQLRAEDFDSNHAAPELGAKARGVALGDIDFFLSHSWHDPPGAKWRAIQAHAAHFVKEKKRTPLLWFESVPGSSHTSRPSASPAPTSPAPTSPAPHSVSLLASPPPPSSSRACLDQGDIAGSLAHLPVHMAGCKKLLVVAGSTYTQRLWALLELYVWVAMGKEHDDIKVLILTSAPLRSDARLTGALSRSRTLLRGNTFRMTQETFHHVSVEYAKCSSAKDRETILAIIETSFTSLHAFDQYIGRLLTKYLAAPERSAVPKRLLSTPTPLASTRAPARATRKPQEHMARAPLGTSVINTPVVV